MKEFRNILDKNCKILKLLPLAAIFLLPMSSFAQTNTNTEDQNRAELKYKQRHSRSTGNNLYADGIKIKRDLSILKEAQEERILSESEIPADELYGGMWSNTGVKSAYTSLTNFPDTFTVDLGNFSMPTMGHVTSNFGARRIGRRGTRMHYGIDLKLQTGDTVYAAFEGKVRVRQYEKRGYGYYIVLRHPNGLETVYGHLSKFLVNEEQVVKSGEPIGLGGNTGRSFGSHLHWELRYLGQAINPRDVVDFDNKVCHKDSYTVTPATFNYAGLSSKSSVRAASYANSATRTKANATNKYATGKVNYHRIKKGDTLGGIARRYGITVSKLCSLNGISTKSVLRPGKTLRTS
ncbi:peptidoglycan DD-metalloendopeptidase family protein [Dysgonomonas sp. 511]|uniref:peptidoglycan DD-metalloendopeptidase family protein n=1 Tax=Dysgonomonas sp. 511 TaxID=2302930 RepID=UPI0013D34093|nr:peptidoglycan DD-metalloendopeptidase family protein [Dysgonomonas sp. 511]NDV79152.1 LysM peptidoglycan-binding domain-containing protein [Dysgonomonas sp. 511]